jgi:hypothetical protein
MGSTVKPKPHPRLIPLDRIKNPEVAEYAQRAADFLQSRSWCRSIVSGHLAWAVAGVLGVFLFRLVPSGPDVDDRLWVIVGDLPPAHLVCDDTPTWREALENYVLEMECWVSAVREGGSLEDVIPVNVAPTREHADMLDSRLTFIRRKILAADAGEIESDT